jgi:hypothetical protein
LKAVSFFTESKYNLDSLFKLLLSGKDKDKRVVIHDVPVEIDVDISGNATFANNNRHKFKPSTTVRDGLKFSVVFVNIERTHKSPKSLLGCGATWINGFSEEKIREALKAALS